eukprot:3411166-Pleurochrysis_carterae.AAC.1
MDGGVMGTEGMGRWGHGAQRQVGEQKKEGGNASVQRWRSGARRKRRGGRSRGAAENLEDRGREDSAR